ncbi:PilZ domain-containing protein [Marinicella sp. S1101]|uniref:PilZ domain-containing protein n=1 Tax=Marinicella marina TaxID=2996016 RepID=UPI00226101BE|nr:PilZ domain-containing protein [Marinicella marina]MCX7555025.1 PilZ domain-containing protein [Marinicella marina]MDJ1141311.1 PilZ domain-containing protein [Marinicella marina]
MAFAGGMAKKGILSLNIQGAAELHQSFMPFVSNGGLFVKTTKNYQIGDDVFMILTLDEDERMPITGKVIWITPKGSQGGRSQGIGVQFNDDSDMEVIKTKIQSILAPYNGQEIPTLTM